MSRRQEAFYAAKLIDWDPAEAAFNAGWAAALSACIDIAGRYVNSPDTTADQAEIAYGIAADIEKELG